jgi:hypothetical protein
MSGTGWLSVITKRIWGTQGLYEADAHDLADEVARWTLEVARVRRFEWLCCAKQAFERRTSPLFLLHAKQW